MKSSIVCRGSTTVTWVSRALKIVAYSMPMTPAPTTMSDRGTEAISSSSSLSMIDLPSKGMVVGR